jgi:hypothetical protein
MVALHNLEHRPPSGHRRLEFEIARSQFTDKPLLPQRRIPVQYRKEAELLESKLKFPTVNLWCVNGRGRFMRRHYVARVAGTNCHTRTIQYKDRKLISLRQFYSSL